MVWTRPAAEETGFLCSSATKCKPKRLDHTRKTRFLIDWLSCYLLALKVSIVATADHTGDVQ